MCETQQSYFILSNKTGCGQDMAWYRASSGQRTCYRVVAKLRSYDLVQFAPPKQPPLPPSVLMGRGSASAARLRRKLSINAGDAPAAARMQNEIFSPPQPPPPPKGQPPRAAAAVGRRRLRRRCQTPAPPPPSPSRHVQWATWIIYRRRGRMRVR